ncbi:MAG: hypothetical protein IH851_06445 [Armatimonadetes bacterium]|nr:hypothetical protein [Armatimonadota bacterium]
MKGWFGLVFLIGMLGCAGDVGGPGLHDGRPKLAVGDELTASGLKLRVVAIETSSYDYAVGDEPPEFGFAFLTGDGDFIEVIPGVPDIEIYVDYARGEIRAGDRVIEIPEGAYVAVAEGVDRSDAVGG